MTEPLTEGSSATSTTRRGLAVMAWMLGLLIAISLATRVAGLKYVQGLIWPSDIPTFLQIPTDVPIDVAILGSSRASFDFPPSAIDRCLTEKLGRRTRTVSLARAYANGSTFRSIVDDLLTGPRAPKVLLLSLDAESLDEHNPQNAAHVAYQAEIEDIPTSVLESDTLDQAFASFRPLVRGPESLALLLARRTLIEERLDWMMINFGGGQYCYGSEPCVENNRDLEDTLRDGWATAERDQLPDLAAERFGHYKARGGRALEQVSGLIALMKERGTKVALVNVPLHAQWMHAMPAEVYREHLEVLQSLSTTFDVPLFDGNTPRRQLEQRDYVDADHLASEPALELSTEVCTDLLAPLLGG